jgi:hypothetical protein
MSKQFPNCLTNAETSNKQLLPSYEVNIKLSTIERLFSLQVYNFGCYLVTHDILGRYLSKNIIKIRE